MNKTTCSCGAEIFTAVLEVGLSKYSCAKNIKTTILDDGGRVSTVFFPHFGIYHGAETGYGEYETIHFASDRRVQGQEFHRDEEMALLHHDRSVRTAQMFAANK